MKANVNERTLNARRACVARSARGVASVLLPFALCLLPFAFGQQPSAHAQEVVDRMIAIVNGKELITYSDLLWQLALQPNVPIDNPRLDDLKRALDILIDQRLIAQEAEKLPSVAPTEKEINDELARLISFFPSRAAFFERLNRVGLGEDSTQLREIVQERVRIRKYLDFRFRSFTVVTPQEVEGYYRDVYVPRRRRQASGQIVPELKAVYDDLKNELIEKKVESETDDFLEEAHNAAQITYLDESLKGGG